MLFKIWRIQRRENGCKDYKRMDLSISMIGYGHKKGESGGDTKRHFFFPNNQFMLLSGVQKSFAKK